MGRGTSGISGGGGGRLTKANEDKEFSKISADIANGMNIGRAYYDISTDFAEKLFNKYDPSDLYSYLTTREQNLAYKDMQGIGANSKQIQMEWKKKAIWRIAKEKAWDELEVW